MGVGHFPHSGTKPHERTSYTSFAEACGVYLKKFDKVQGGGSSSPMGRCRKHQK